MLALGDLVELVAKSEEDAYQVTRRQKERKTDTPSQGALTTRGGARTLHAHAAAHPLRLLDRRFIPRPLQRCGVRMGEEVRGIQDGERGGGVDV